MKPGYLFNNVSCTGEKADLTESNLSVIADLLARYTSNDIPVLPAYHRPVNSTIRTKEGERIPHPGVWCVWCVDCDTWHEHGPDFGHRVAHCPDPNSRYYARGYALAYAGEWRDCFERGSRAMRRSCQDCPEPHPCGRAIPSNDPKEPKR